MISMTRVNRIIQHERFDEYRLRNEVAEAQRIYCRHGADHGLNVARIAYIYLLEQRASVDKEIIYAAGLLHDIGRWVEYETREDHALASARLARSILEECDFNHEEMETILWAIQEHRLKPNEASSPLGQALALADDWARDCKQCKSKSTCYKYTRVMEELVI